MTDVPAFGVNLPWLDGAYGHDLAPNEQRPGWPCELTTLRAYKPLIHAQSLGFEVVRVWLCENGEGIVTEGGKPKCPHARLVESVDVLQECARLLGMRIYWTLLDGNSWKQEKDALTRAIMNDADACARFAEGVAAPLVKRLDPEVTFAVEVINEPEALSPNREDDVPWHVLGRSIRRMGDAVRSALPGTMVTAGTGHVYLPQLFRAEPGLDAVDLHIYHATGGLPSREDVAALTGDRRVLDGSLPLIGGECGMAEGAPTVFPSAMTNYLYNAERLGYAAAFLWRLEDPLVDASGKNTQLAWDVQEAMTRLRV